MSDPLVSICLPNLNNREFLGARLDSIRFQTHANWELIVVDSHSDDGAWELLQSAAAVEPRMRISQAPRGMYAGWNQCIRQAKGEFIYIATSDDTMQPECVEVLVSALARHADCQIATCNVEFIDANGASKGLTLKSNPAEKCYGSLLARNHVRLARFDVPVLLGAGCIPVSVTGALYRRSVFADIGLFPEDLGPMGDYAWNLKSAFRLSKVHVPRTLASWRIHRAQATQFGVSVKMLSQKHRILGRTFADCRKAGWVDPGFSFARCIRPQIFAGLVTVLLTPNSIKRRCAEVLGILRLDPWVLPLLLIRLLTRRPVSRWPHPDMIKLNMGLVRLQNDG